MKFSSEETLFVTIIIAAIVSLQGVTSQSEWHRLDDAVYLVDSITRLDYDQAQALCQGYGANLARVDSDEIQAFLTSFITPPLRDTRCFWIGCNDREVEGQFRWLDSTPVIYDGWAQGQPDNRGRDQNCACLWSSRSNDKHGQWDDDRCTVDRNMICQKGIYNFRLMIPRTNPGFAYVYCAADAEIEGETLSPDDVKVSIGQTLSSSRPISFSSTSLDGEFRNNSFLLYNVTEGDQIFCYAGELPDQNRSFSLATLSAIFDFYALPELPSGPTVGEISSSSVTVFWSSWIPCLDPGDGPIVGYLIYQQTMEEEQWTVAGRIDSGVGEGDLQRIMEFVLTELEPGTEYNISVSAVREGPGGEGPRSPLVAVTTASLESQRLRKTNAAWMVLFVISFLGIIILAIAIVILCKRKQKKEDLSRLRAAPSAGDPKSPHYELPQPSVVRPPAYQDLKRTGISNIKEEVYADIIDPEKPEYVNSPSGVQK
ncbi:uncharacterized protein LOC105438950 [Strongylocentrotus purpuratus]|uniref:C-type lectin n=1 Tax=Strongylocentrotus purpuratus TaxID=7668 RepID=A0A7M7P543_STRPU|nr:uncharacterized protein LOC105438950 [Strongylocentrotus purpuratus]